jgi:hypothetical protein
MKSFSETLTTALSGLVGQTVPRPTGTLAGHAAGLPFERLVDEVLRRELPGQTFRHYELLNKLYQGNPTMRTSEERYALLGPPSLQYLLRRGKSATEKWTNEDLFEEKQNDTAEIVILPSRKIAIEVDHVRPVRLIDVKTQDTGKKAQAPNIISAEKIANVCKLALQSEGFLPFEILYVGIKWRAGKSILECTEVRVVSLTEIDPKDLYINWAAALQIQFHPFEVETSYVRDGMTWARDYLKNFCNQLERRIASETEKLESFRSIL